MQIDRTFSEAGLFQAIFRCYAGKPGQGARPSTAMVLCMAIAVAACTADGSEDPGATQGGGSSTDVGGGSSVGGQGGAGGDEAYGPAYVFITSERWNGAFSTTPFAEGELSADEKCNESAQDAGLPGSYSAFLSPGIYRDENSDESITSDVRASDRVKGSGPWVAVGSSVTVFASRNELEMDEVILEGRLLTEFGVEAESFPGEGTALLYWTGVGSTGNPGASCARWTSSDFNTPGTIGCFSGCQPSQWRYFAGVLGASPCQNEHRLLCFRDTE